MSKVIIIVIAAVVVGGFFLFKGSQPSSENAPTVPVDNETVVPLVSEPSSGAATPQPPVGQAPAAEEKAVTYTDAGYSPATLTLKKGETATFKNQSSRSMWPASAMHPTHRVYGGTSLDEHCPDTADFAFDACKGILPAGEWSFKFDKVGTWKYHNHLSPGDTGTMVVE